MDSNNQTLRFKYQTIEFGETDIHLRTLRDRQEFYDENGVAEALGISSGVWSYFGVVWPSSEVLAHTLVNYPTKGKKILEVGCGIGLTSILLNHLQRDITATDYHPEVESFLEINTDLNKDKAIPFVRTSWNDSNPQLGKFDLIIGSDLLYERDHGVVLSKFINEHANHTCEVIIVDPDRGNHSKFKNAMLEQGFECNYIKPTNINYLTHLIKEKFLLLPEGKHFKFVNSILSKKIIWIFNGR